MSQKRREKRDINRKNIKMYNSRIKDNDNTLKIFRRIILVCLLLVIFYPPFLRGLFFETEQLFTEIFVFAIYITFWVYKYLKRDRRFLTTPLDYAALGFVAVYFISLFPAIDKYLAISEWLKYCMYFAIFHMISEIVVTYRSKIIILWTIVVTACSVSVMGLDALASGKLVDALNRLFSAIGITKALGLKNMFFELTTGNRISSTFQYPNALAAYLMAVFFVTAGLISTSKKIWIKALGGCAGSILFLTFMLTSSRGAYLMFPVAAIIFLISLPKGSRLNGLFNSLPSLIVGGLASFRILGLTANAGANYSKVWIYIVLSAVISGVLTIVMSYVIKVINKLNWKVYVISVSALVLIAVVGLIYVLNVTQPVELSHKVGETDSCKAVQKSEVLDPEKEYKLIFKIDASMTDKKPNAYSIIINSRSNKDILFDRMTQVESLAGQATKGIETHEISFKVPADSEIVKFTFTNTYQGTKAIFYDASIQEADSGKTIKKLALRYKYIPDALVSRLDDIRATKSGVQRLVYYKDGLGMVKERPLFGAGGGSWPLLYFPHQSFLYFSTQAHNYLLQLGVETGIIGLLVLLVLLLSIVFIYVFDCKHRNYADSVEDKVLQAAILTGICALFMHSYMDFDFSLGAVFMLVWVLLGLYNSRYQNMNMNVLELDLAKNRLTRWIASFAGKFADAKKAEFSPVIGIAITIAVAIIPVFFLIAKSYAGDSIIAKAQNNQELAINKMKIASTLNPFKTVYKIDYASLLVERGSLSGNEAKSLKSYVYDAEKAAKYNINLSKKVGGYHLFTGSIDKGLEYFDHVTALKPLDPNAWAERTNAYMQVVSYYLQNNDKDNTVRYADKALAFIGEAQTVNKKNMNPFIFNENTSEMLEKMAFLKQNEVEIQPDYMNKIVLNLVPDLDINSDNIPDQWTIPDPSATKVNVEDGIMVVDNTKTGYGNIISRKLNLTAGKNYTIAIELTNSEAVDKIDYNLVGVSKENGVLTKSGNWFTADISVPTDFKADNNVLQLGIPGKVSIKDTKIYEK